MTMFSYADLYKPYTHGEHTLEKTREWLIKTAKIDADICDQVIADTMGMLAHGVKFPLPCPCGCGFDLPNATIDHFMLARASQVKKQVQTARIGILQEMEKKRVEDRMKQLSDFDKEYAKMKYIEKYGTWADRNIPTFKKWFTRK